MAVTIPVKREFLSKKACLREAERLLGEGRLRSMSKGQIAREIYFHAFVLYFCDRTGLFNKYRLHADPINMTDGGDTAGRRAAYAVCWLITISKKG